MSSSPSISYQQKCPYQPFFLMPSKIILRRCVVALSSSQGWGPIATGGPTSHSSSLVFHNSLHHFLSLGSPLPIANSILLRTDRQHLFLLLRTERGKHHTQHTHTLNKQQNDKNTSTQDIQQAKRCRTEVDHMHSHARGRDRNPTRTLLDAAAAVASTSQTSVTMGTAATVATAMISATCSTSSS